MALYIIVTIVRMFDELTIMVLQRISIGALHIATRPYKATE